MKTFQEAFYLETRNPLLRLSRNVRLFGYILRMIWFWGLLGGRVRRAVRRSQRSGHTYYIDELA